MKIFRILTEKLKLNAQTLCINIMPVMIRKYQSPKAQRLASEVMARVQSDGSEGMDSSPGPIEPFKAPKEFKEGKMYPGKQAGSFIGSQER